MKFLLSLFLMVTLPLFGAVPSYTSFRGAGGIIVVTNPPTGTIVIDGSGVVSSGTNSAIGTYTNGTAVSMAATNNNFTAGNNTVLRGTNIGSTAHINYGVESNLTFNTGLGPVVVGSWGDVWGISNVSLGHLAMWLPEVDSSSEMFFQDNVIVGGIVQATNVTLTAIPGTGTNVGITAGGTLFRTTTTGGTDTNIGVGQTLYLDKAFGVDATAARTNLVRTFQTPSNSVAAMLSGDTLVVRGGAYPINPKADPVNEPSFVNYSAGVAISNKSNIRIVGEPGAVWYMSSWRSNGYGFSMPMMWFQNCTNVVIDGMTFIGMRTNATNFGYGGLVLNGCDEVTVKNCTFSNWQNHAIVAQSASTVNSRLRFWNNTFADCGGTNHVTLTMDGTAINVEASNFEAVGNRFYRNLRNIEFCCNSDVRKVLIELNTSEGCYFADMVLHATNSSEVIIANNISKGYAGVLLPGASADSASWLDIHSGSNVMVRGNIVGGYHNGITAAPAAGGRIVDIKMEGNTFHDITAIPIGIPAQVQMVGNSALVERLTVRNNKFLNCASVAVFLNASDSIVSDNEFYDCNLGAFAQGVISIGYHQALISTNSTNISIVGNKLVSSAANAGPGIVIYGMSYSNTVHGNEISRKYATNIHDLGVGTRTRPVNLVAPGSLLRSDALGDERAVTIGSGVTFDGTTLSATGGGSGASTNPLASASVNTLFSAPTRLVFDGDSLTSSNFSHPFYTSNRLGAAGASLIISNTAVSGQTIPQMISRYTNFVQPNKPVVGTNAILFTWGGINDLYFATNHAALIISTLSNYWFIAKADGFTLVAFTISSRSNFQATTNENDRATINSWIRQQSMWDYLVDVDAVFPWWDTETHLLEGASYIHFNTNSQRVISDLSLETLFNPRRIFVPPSDVVTRYAGVTYFVSGTAALPSIAFDRDRQTGFSDATLGSVGLSCAGVGEHFWGATVYRISSDITVQWASGSGYSTAGDVGFSRLAANSLALGNGVNGNTSGTLTLSNVYSGGSVGIRTTSPTNALDVNGDASIRTNLFLPNLPTNASPVALLAVDGGGKVFETVVPSSGISGIIAGNSNQIPYLDHTGTNYTYGAGPLSGLTAPGFGFRPTGPHGGYGGLLAWSDSPMGLLTIGHPNPASDFATPATALVVSNRYNGAADFQNDMVKFEAVMVGGGLSSTSTLSRWRVWQDTASSNDVMSIDVSGLLKVDRIQIGDDSAAAAVLTLSDANGTNYQLTTPTMTSNVFERGPKNMIPGVRVYFNETGTNQATNMPMMVGSSSLDFPSTVAGSSFDLPITVTGCTSNNCHVSLGVPWQAASGGGIFTHFESNDVVYVRFSNNQLTLAIDPTPATFSAMVFKLQ